MNKRRECESMTRTLYRALVIAVAWLLFAGPACAAEFSFSRLLERYRQSGSAVLTTECAIEDGGKALLILTVAPEARLWFHTVANGSFTSGVQVVMIGNDFRFVDPPGGHGTRAVIRRYIEGLLKQPWTFLTPDEIPTLDTSMPAAKCRTLGFDEG